jgi:hypothetical protein
MMCLRASRLKIGRSSDAEGRVRAGAGIVIRSFSGSREGVACAGRQSLGQCEKDISACGEKRSPSPWSSPRRRGNNIRCLAVHRRASTSGDHDLSAAAGRPIQWERPNAVPSPGGEGQDEGELPAPKAVTLSSVPGSSVSACGERSSPSPWSSPRGEEIPSADLEGTDGQGRRPIDRVRRLDCRSNEQRIPGLKAREVTARGEAQRSPGERPAIYPRPVRPEHRCTECAGLSGLGISAPPDPGPPGRAVTSQAFGRDTNPGDRCHPHSRSGWFRSERCRRYALSPQYSTSFPISVPR